MWVIASRPTVGGRVHTEDMAKDYESEATVVIDGVEKPVYARFTVFTDGGLKQWHGGLGSDDTSLSWELLNAQSVLLRMPDGREGVIVPSGRDGEEGVGFVGSGPAPI